MKENRIPTLIGILILVFSIAAGLILVQFRQIFRIGADSTNAPKDVRVGNVTDSSFSVSWTTTNETPGFVKWGESESSLDKVEEDEIVPSGFTHLVTIRGLTQGTSYFFKINSGGSDYDNNGITWQVKTGPEIPGPERPLLISGQVLTQTGSPSNNSLVYLTIAGTLLTTSTSQSGSWAIPLAQARTSDLSSYISIDDTQTLLEIFVQAGPDGVASAQVYPQSAQPVPPISLGQVLDFKNLPPSQSGETPESSLEVPEESVPISGFQIQGGISQTSPSAVTLESISQGEVVTSTEPEFIGEGPAGIIITVTVESEPQTAQVKIPQSGNWNWSPPSGLSEGVHKITITWKDSGGITRTLTRNFVVQAAEGPAFESSPSATLSPNPSPTITPISTFTPEPTFAPTLTPSPEPIPVSGSLTPTIIVTIMGITILLFSFLIWKYSEI